MELIKNKRIGKILFIVEGSKHEFSLIKKIFDRDPKSNTDSKLILNLINTLKNSRENDNNLLGGMLILSYPSIEAYEISNFCDASYLLSAEIGDDIKQFIVNNAKNISVNKITTDSIIHACNELMNYAAKHKITFNFDNFSNANEKIFYKEEQYYQKNHSYFLLSMMSCVLLDLGILKEHN